MLNIRYLLNLFLILLICMPVYSDNIDKFNSLYSDGEFVTDNYDEKGKVFVTNLKKSVLGICYFFKIKYNEEELKEKAFFDYLDIHRLVFKAKSEGSCNSLDLNYFVEVVGVTDTVFLSLSQELEALKKGGKLRAFSDKFESKKKFKPSEELISLFKSSDKSWISKIERDDTYLDLMGLSLIHIEFKKLASGIRKGALVYLDGDGIHLVAETSMQN